MMSVEHLIFNGVDGTTGSYALTPMTSGELVSHILKSTTREQDELGNKLGRDNADKIAKIVRLLAESNIEDVKRGTAWHSQWIEKLAEHLATELLGEEYSRPDKIKGLERRLKRHTVDKLEDIVKYLVAGNTKELAKLLLKDQDEELDDNSSVLKEYLKHNAMSRISDVQKDLLTASCADDLERKTASRDDWLEALITTLQLIPITALNTIKGVRIRSLEPLVKELDTLAKGTTSPNPWLEALCEALRAKPSTISWNDLLETLRGGLDARIAVQDDEVSWGDLLAALYKWLAAVREPLAYLGTKEGIDPTDLAQAGWGIIFPYEDPRLSPKVPGIRKALEPLLELRQSQAGERFHIYDEANGYRPNDTASTWLGRKPRLAQARNPVDPEKVPYYLLIVGSPEEIPFHFQYQLDVQYAVGRIDFDDLEAYANYARSVVAVEKQGVKLVPETAFFGAANPDDRMTELSAKHLVKPLYRYVERRYGSRWQINAALQDDAKKARLMSMMGGKETPALLFAACHGIEFPKDDAKGRQLQHQGALLCQEWRGPVGGRGEVPRDYYLTGEDLVERDVNLLGLIALFFACYSAGTPRYDEYYKQDFKERGRTIAEQAFIAELPKAMLSLSKGGALAVIGHVERVWGTSFLGVGESEQIAVFESAVERLLKGHPVGWAMEYFNGRYAALSTELTDAIDRAEMIGTPPDAYGLAELWTANNDARGYIVVGDPAVRLPVAETAAEATGRRDLSEK